MALTPSPCSDPRATACPLCGGSGARPAPLPAAALAGHRLRFCADCGFGFLDEPPGPLHARPESAAAAPGQRRLRWLARLRLRPVLRDLRRWHPGPPGSVLDAGCGLGDLAWLLAGTGWEAWGCDPAADARVACQPLLGKRFVPADVVEAELPRAYFDVILLNFSLEHVTEPGPVASRVRELLRPGGVTLVRVPNFGAALSGRRGASFQLRLPHHRSFFTAASLTRLLRSSGLEPLAMSTPASLQESMSIVSELVPPLDPERWMYAPRGPASLLRAALLALLAAPVQPWTGARCRRGEGLVLHAAARRPVAA